MEIKNTRTPSPLLTHVAGFHSSDHDLLEQLLPLVAAGLAHGRPVAVALRPATTEAVYDAFGSLPGLLQLAPPEGNDGGSGQTLAARRARQLRELTLSFGPVTVVTEHWNRFDGHDGSFWTELDAATNIALSDLPVHLTCFFPEMPLHLEVVDGARRNHPLLLHRDGPRHNPDHRAPREVLAERPAPAPVLLGAPDTRMVFGAWQLNEVRATVERSLLAHGYGRDRAEDVVLAVNEVATNAVEHGTGEALISVWEAADGFVFEIQDAGSLRDPMPGLRAPHPSEARGRGVWIARQLCDSLHVWPDRTGTHVRMRATP
ncbi:MAG: ATP-binding protein [Pseudonocardia sp.]|uniref:ATP-binding protein n=1 Tax=Pseudonocardia sp. TaxID=60912 RepID=UPI001ACC4094|nr:ATP-binding protein [Pseudonocardia sp.]MBN9098450.1 ATP-binding protein [Pseudonocardia sp.]